MHDQKNKKRKDQFLRKATSVNCLRSILFLSIMSASCSTLQKIPTSLGFTPSEPESKLLVDYKKLIVKGESLRETRFDYPITVNSRVEYWVEYFTGRGRKHFEKYLERSNFFIPYIQRVLRENQVPEDLVYLAMIESGFHNHARSFARAVGPWQFIPATGRNYGLRVDWWVDERRDTTLSTQAAIRYLSDLYAQFGSWELASAAYNAGEAKIARAVKRYGTKDYWALTRQRFLTPESRNYVPKIIAAALVAKNREQFGFEPAKKFKLSDLEKQTQVEPEPVASEEEEIKEVVPPQEENEESIDPLDKKEEESEAAPTEEEEDLAYLAEDVRTKDTKYSNDSVAILSPGVNKKGEVYGEQVTFLELPSPVDLLQVSETSGVSYQSLKALNPSVLRWVTPPDQKTFTLRMPSHAVSDFLKKFNQPGFARKAKFKVYKVKNNGTSPRDVGNVFGLRQEAIMDLNDVSKSKRYRKGDLVLIPIPQDFKGDRKVLELRDPPSRKRYRKRRYRRR